MVQAKVHEWNRSIYIVTTHWQLSAPLMWNFTICKGHFLLSPTNSSFFFMTSHYLSLHIYSQKRWKINFSPSHHWDTLTIPLWLTILKPVFSGFQIITLHLYPTVCHQILFFSLYCQESCLISYQNESAIVLNLKILHISS